MVLQENHGANRYVCGLFWPLLRMGVCTMMHSQLAYVYHGSRAVKCWPFLYYCYSFTVSLVRMTTIHCKIYADFVNRPCLQRTRTMRRATQFALRG